MKIITRKGNHKNCLFPDRGSLFIPTSRRPSPALKGDVLSCARRFGRASGALCTFFCPVVVDVRSCWDRRWDVGRYAFPGAAGPIRIPLRGGWQIDEERCAEDSLVRAHQCTRGDTWASRSERVASDAEKQTRLKLFKGTR